MPARRAARALLAGALALAAPGPALAHAFGARYDLPLPLSLYLAGAGAAVALSFVVVALFVRRDPPREPARGIDLLGLPVLGLLGRPVVRGAVRIAAVALFALVLATGFAGVQSTTRNFAPPFVWVIWWVGMAYVCALAGNLWLLVNPWRIVFDRVQAAARAAGCSGAGGARTLPAGVGCWPAVALFAAFAWLEMVSSVGEAPRPLAWLVLAYSLLTWTGMAIFGRDAWLAAGEAFHVAFGVLARFAPTAPERAGRRPALRLRPFGAGLVGDRPASASLTAFVLLMLATVSYDGFIETETWAGLLDWMATSEALRPLLLALRGAGVDLLAAIETTGLVVFPLLFLAVYLAFSAAVARLGGGGSVGSSVGTGAVARRFVLSLVPIAIAYHLAHYLSYLLLAGQLVIPLASDPFGFGWDLLGTADYRIDISVTSARLSWYTAVVAIVAGHVVAVWVAHRTALATFRDRRAALLSQLPMLVLMVGYTMTSLWILSQPIVETAIE